MRPSTQLPVVDSSKESATEIAANNYVMILNMFMSKNAD